MFNLTLYSYGAQEFSTHFYNHAILYVYIIDYKFIVFIINDTILIDKWTIELSYVDKISMDYTVK